MKPTNEWEHFGVGKKFLKSNHCQKKTYRERFIIPFLISIFPSLQAHYDNIHQLTF